MGCVCVCVCVCVCKKCYTKLHSRSVSLALGEESHLVEADGAQEEEVVLCQLVADTGGREDICRQL